MTDFKTISVKLIFCSIVIMFFCSHVNAQINTNTVVNTGGGSSLLAPQFMVDWSIGETAVIDTYSGVNLFSSQAFTDYWYLTCGILQPFDNTRLFYGSGAPATNWTPAELRLYPIPAKDIITLDFRSYITGKVSVFLYDKKGVLLRKKTVIQYNAVTKQDWDISMYQTGIYFFNVLLQSMDELTVIKSGAFQVIKL